MASDRLAFIIGASRGIGSAAALRLARDGFNIAASCRGDTSRLDGLRSQVEAMGRTFLPVSLDVTDKPEWAKEVSVNADGNIVLTVQPRGLVFMVN